MLFKLLIKIFPNMFCETPEIEFKVDLKSNATPQEVFAVNHCFSGKYLNEIANKCISIEEYNELPKNVQRHFFEVPYNE